MFNSVTKRVLRSSLVATSIVIGVGLAGPAAALASSETVNVPVPGNPCTVTVSQYVNPAVYPPASASESSTCKI